MTTKKTNIKYVYANRSYIILGIEWVRNCNGYECIGDVEDEIISAVPEYMQIRQKIHSVMEV